jgi:hypothetical protein
MLRVRNIVCPSITDDGKCTIDSGRMCICLDQQYCQCRFEHKHVIPDPKCPNCGGPLEVRYFIDTRDFEDKPCDVNWDLYCPKCDLRWMDESGPHEFYK